MESETYKFSSVGWRQLPETDIDKDTDRQTYGEVQRPTEKDKHRQTDTLTQKDTLTHTQTKADTDLTPQLEPDVG